MALKAGVGRSVITPHIGATLVGYFNRPGPSNGIHDDLNARAVVLDDGNTAIALCSVEMCWLAGANVQAIRKVVASRCALKPENVFVVATHTHSGPAPQNDSDWDRPLAKSSRMRLCRLTTRASMPRSRRASGSCSATTSIDAGSTAPLIRRLVCCA